MSNDDLTVKIIKGYVVTSKDGKNNAFDENEIKSMIIDHFKMSEDLRNLSMKFNELHNMIYVMK